MKNILKNFIDKPFYDAGQLLFKTFLGQPLSTKTAQAIPLTGLIQNPTKATAEIIDSQPEVYYLGKIDDTFLNYGSDSIFGEQSYDEVINNINSKYKGIIVFGLKFKADYQPSSANLFEFARAMNKVSKSIPVLVIVQYEKDDTPMLAVASAERNSYKRKGLEGEKIGDVSILKDIDLNNPHYGDIQILEQLKKSEIENTNKKTIKSFDELYASWLNVLNISYLNSLFYAQIEDWFDRTIKTITLLDYSKQTDANVEFTIRLIARMLFIWFLKERKVVDERLLLPKLLDGSVNELIQPTTNNSSYYKYVLQNLFFQCINTPKGERDFDAFKLYANFEDKYEIEDLLGKAPYLNGGLFEADATKDIYVEDKATPTFQVPDELFLGEKGLNTILSKYKFTLKENNTENVEIAVDPKMLGLIFENLLAAQNEDTKESARKNKGAFYTPRPIVSYMSKSVLKKHLGVSIEPKNAKVIVHKLLHDTKIIDPACGSGAFIIGVLNEMMEIINTVDTNNYAFISEILKLKDPDFQEHIAPFISDGQIEYVKKLALLRNCLYGVDIQPYAIEISKLRCWLSIFIEQKVDLADVDNNYKLKPLPNLDFKFHCKDSLLRKFGGEYITELIEKRFKGATGYIVELIELEKTFFITHSAKSDKKEEIRNQIIEVLENITSDSIDTAERDLLIATKTYNDQRNKSDLYGNKDPQNSKEIKAAEKAMKKAKVHLNYLLALSKRIKNYLVETILFPDVFNLYLNKEDRGFDIVIGNPPYVNTKLISKMGLTDTLKNEYEFCDDLYNHFTFRGIELLKKGGYLSYITSDTFLTIQSKDNMRRLLLDLPQKPSKSASNQGSLNFGSSKDCRMLEVINTPKAFAAMVDTAIFTIQKTASSNDDVTNYVDLRFPNADTFDMTEGEWNAMTKSTKHSSGWERILKFAFEQLTDEADFQVSHTCGGEAILVDTSNKIEKYQLPIWLYRQSLNNTIFSPNPFNAEVFDKIIQPAAEVFNLHWDKIKTSREFEKNRKTIAAYTQKLKPGDFTLLGLLVDGGVGLQAGDNGNFVGALAGTKLATRIKATRPDKLWDAIENDKTIVKKFPQLSPLDGKADCEDFLNKLSELEIRTLFDEIKEKTKNPRAFGKGYLYRIVQTEEIQNVEDMTDEEKEFGIDISEECFVPYDKGDKEGNRWYLETPNYINWNRETVSFLKRNSGKKGQGMPVVRNPQFYFRSGFCWSDILNPNSEYVKCRLKGETVNDVKSMSLYDTIDLDTAYYVFIINSFVSFKIIREFLNSTVSLQINDLRKLPILIPTEKQLEAVRGLFNQCLLIQKSYFSGDIEKVEARAALAPIEAQIDALVYDLYDIQLRP